MTFTLNIDETHLIARLDKIVPNVHDALLRNLRPIASSLAASARSLAAAHIHIISAKPGLYLASIYGGVSDKNGAVIGYVRTGNPLAHFLDRDEPFTIPAHDIIPSSADVLSWLGDSGQVYAKIVHSPGATVPPYPAIKPAFEGAEAQIREAITESIEQGAAG